MKRDRELLTTESQHRGHLSDNGGFRYNLLKLVSQVLGELIDHTVKKVIIQIDCYFVRKHYQIGFSMPIVSARIFHWRHIIDGIDSRKDPFFLNSTDDFVLTLFLMTSQLLIQTYHLPLQRSLQTSFQDRHYLELVKVN